MTENEARLMIAESFEAFSGDLHDLAQMLTNRREYAAAKAMRMTALSAADVANGQRTKVAAL